jgi:hypothetical protein
VIIVLLVGKLISFALKAPIFRTRKAVFFFKKNNLSSVDFVFIEDIIATEMQTMTF